MRSALFASVRLQTRHQTLPNTLRPLLMASACAQRQVLGVRSAKTRIFTTRRSRRLRRGGTGLPEDQGRVSGARKRPVALHKRRLLRRAARWTRCSSRAPSARRGAARTRVPGRRLRRRGQGGGRGGNRRRAGPRRRADGVGEERQARRLQPEVMALKRSVLCLVFGYICRTIKSGFVLRTF